MFGQLELGTSCSVELHGFSMWCYAKDVMLMYGMCVCMYLGLCMDILHQYDIAVARYSS